MKTQVLTSSSRYHCNKNNTLYGTCIRKISLLKAERAQIVGFRTERTTTRYIERPFLFETFCLSIIRRRTQIMVFQRQSEFLVFYNLVYCVRKMSFDKLKTITSKRTTGGYLERKKKRKLELECGNNTLLPS